ncbi:MAG: nucleoside hydrolase, partial [Chloroflexota bacterium]
MAGDRVPRESDPELSDEPVGSRGAPLLPVILDVDTGIDDSLALLYARASPEIAIVAVTCVAGNVGAAEVARNTRAVLELAGRGEMRVALGADRPLVKPLETAEETHGPEGIGHATLPDPAGALDELDAPSR